MGPTPKNETRGPTIFELGITTVIKETGPVS